MHLRQLRSPRWRLDGFYFYLSQRRACFLDLKKLEKLEAQIQASPVQDSRSDAACVKVASSLTFCAHGSLQSFSKSDKKKRPKTDPPGKTFALRKGPKLGPRHSESGASLGACLTPHANTLLNRGVRIKLHISTSHMTFKRLRATAGQGPMLR